MHMEGSVGCAHDPPWSDVGGLARVCARLDEPSRRISTHTETARDPAADRRGSGRLDGVVVRGGLPGCAGWRGHPVPDAAPVGARRAARSAGVASHYLWQRRAQQHLELSRPCRRRPCASGSRYATSDIGSGWSRASGGSRVCMASRRSRRLPSWVAVVFAPTVEQIWRFDPLDRFIPLGHDAGAATGSRRCWRSRSRSGERQELDIALASGTPKE